jgi:hypothetical protein
VFDGGVHHRRGVHPGLPGALRIGHRDGSSGQIAIDHKFEFTHALRAAGDDKVTGDGA